MAFKGARVLVTGAGGYIGSAISKAVAEGKPDELILLDSSEQNLFDLRRAMAAGFPLVPRQDVLGSVEDAALMDELFTRFHPQLVLHAAAFKHVELLELNPFPAIRNNALGTYTLARAALRHGCDSLVLVSTDKAVRPHSIMGISKRIAEIIVVSLSSPACRMNAIRLGNVMGSTGSVVPIFLDQIASGKAVTVTHPEASRYFMTIEQTVSSILAAVTGRFEGCVLLPQFDAPVRIIDLAQKLINGTGTVPIEFIGLRPGEKLTEDLIGLDEEPDGSTEGFLTALRTAKVTPKACEMMVQRLSDCLAARDLPALRQVLTSIVPEYVPSALMLP